MLLVVAINAAETTFLVKQTDAPGPSYEMDIFPDSAYIDYKEQSDLSFPLKATKNSNNFATIEVVGNKFFNSVTGEQFFLKGIAYQPGRASNDAVAFGDALSMVDPMANPGLCLRDLPFLKGLGVNTVRVYSIDTDKNHDECFNAFRDAGIYVIADLSEPNASINRDSPIWDIKLLNRYKSVVDVLHKYDNVLGFFAGNEVISDKTNTDASPFVKSSIRDIKEYIKEKNYREIPVGYSTNDDAETRDDLALYFACGDVVADFYGINMYEWCGFSSFHSSGYRERTEEFKNYPIPVFFSEFGCNLQRPRPFTEVEALFGPLMTDTWSGGLAYMYFEEENEYGVVEIGANGEVTPLPDYYCLQRAYKSADPKGVNLEEYKKFTKPSAFSNCPVKSAVWKASNVLPQSPDQAKCECMERSLKCRLASDIKQSELKQVFEFACNKVDCSAIRTDGVGGEYGSFSDCTSQQKASYILNEVFKKGTGEKEECNFHGLAQLATAYATEKDLETIFLQNGKTCAAVLGEDLLSQILNYETPLNKAISRNSTDLTNGHDNPFDNRASTQKFYKNLGIDVGIAFVVVAFMTVMA
jgi:hypothetical protein